MACRTLIGSDASDLKKGSITMNKKSGLIVTLGRQLVAGCTSNNPGSAGTTGHVARIGIYDPRAVAASTFIKSAVLVAPFVFKLFDVNTISKKTIRECGCNADALFSSHLLLHEKEDIYDEDAQCIYV
jgi:hypothetical protein